MARASTEQATGAAATTTPREQLEALVAAHPGSLVAAVGADGRLVPMPESLRRVEQRPYTGRTAIDAIVVQDHALVLETWERAQTEPVLEVQVRLNAHPDRTSPLHVFDLRPEHGVIVAVLIDDDPDAVLAAAAEHAVGCRRVGRVRRDSMGTFLAVDEAATALLGWAAHELVRRSTVELLHPDDVERALDAWTAMRAGQPVGPTQVRFRHASGHHVWIEVVNENRLEDPEVGCVLSELRDISAEMTALEALHQRERLLARLAEALPIGIAHAHLDGRVVYANAPFTELLGPVGDLDAVVERLSPEDRSPVRAVIEQARAGVDDGIEVGIGAGGSVRRCEVTLRTLTGDDGRPDGLIVCAADVTERSRLRAELEHRATHDALSGCLNRAAIVTAVERRLAAGERLTVAYVDLDGFKTTNDRLGHAAGDDLLRSVAARLRGAIRATDDLGRVGGDEFVVVVGDELGGDRSADPDRIARRIHDAITGEVAVAGARVPVRASVGAVRSRPGEHDAEALLSRADQAMYDAKRAGRAQPPRPGTTRYAS